MTKRMMMLIYRLFLHAYLLIYPLIYMPTKETRRSIRDTKWSGQSSVGTRSLAYSLTHLTTYSLTEESVMSTRTYSDLTSRIGLAFGDVISLLSFAAIGRSNHGAHSLTYSLTHLLTHSPTHSLTYSLTHLLTQVKYSTQYSYSQQHSHFSSPG